MVMNVDAFWAPLLVLLAKGPPSPTRRLAPKADRLHPSDCVLFLRFAQLVPDRVPGVLLVCMGKSVEPVSDSAPPELHDPSPGDSKLLSPR